MVRQFNSCPPGHFIGLILSFIALALLLPFFASAQQFEDNNGHFIRKGFKYTPGKTTFTTISVMDPSTGDAIYMQAVDSSLPLNINGSKVYGLTEVTTPVGVNMGQQMTEESLLNNLKDYLGQLYFSGPDSSSVRVDLENVVVDEKGMIVFFEFTSVKALINGLPRHLVMGELSEKINKLLTEMPPLKPATLNGVNVMSYADINLHRYKISGASKAFSWVYDGNTSTE